MGLLCHKLWCLYDFCNVSSRFLFDPATEMWLVLPILMAGTVLASDIVKKTVYRSMFRPFTQFSVL